jgi:hypothetical protein
MLTFLLESGADINAKSGMEETALQTSIFEHQVRRLGVEVAQD